RRPPHLFSPLLWCPPARPQPVGRPVLDRSVSYPPRSLTGFLYGDGKSATRYHLVIVVSVRSGARAGAGERRAGGWPPRRLYAQDAEAAVVVVEGDALDDAGDFLGSGSALWDCGVHRGFIFAWA